MKSFAHVWMVGLSYEDGEPEVSGALMHCDVTTGQEVGSYEFSGSSRVIFEELLTVLDASIFTSLAIAEGVLPEGQLPLG